MPAGSQPPSALSRPLTYVSLDLETTGFLPSEDEIIDVGAVRFTEAEVLGTFTSLVRPSRAVPYAVQQLTGIREEELRRAPPMAEVAPALAQFIGSDPVVGHNVGFDVEFLRPWDVGQGNSALDSWQLARVVLPTRRSHSLASLAETLGLPAVPHRALADAELVRRLVLELVRLGETVHPTVLQAIVEMASRCAWELAPLFRRMLAGSVRHAFRHAHRPLELARLEEGLAQLAPAEPRTSLRPVEQAPPLDPPALRALLSPGGRLASALGGYEERPQQLAMLEAVARAFRDGQHLLAEAGTGTGKSLAYLLPAAVYAVGQGRRVVISTNTINLQEQLWEKDLPHLLATLGLPAGAALLKGRGNYVCLRRLRALRTSPTLSPPAAALVARVLVWLSMAESTRGDQGEMGTLAREELTWWARISSQSGECRQSSCGGRAPCYFYRARQRAEGAHLVVVNHALLLTDRLKGGTVLPEFWHLIADEAHHLEEVATQVLSFQGGEQELEITLRELSASLRLLGGAIPRLGLPAEERGRLGARLEGAQGQLGGLRRAAAGLAASLRELWRELEGTGPGGDYRVRLTPALRSSPGWTGVEVAWADAWAAYQGLRRPVLDLLEALEGEEHPLAYDLRHAHAQHEQLWSGLARVLGRGEPGTVSWLERRGPGAGAQSLSLNLAPVHVGEELRQRLFEPLETVVLTSATLQAQGSFGYLRERLGLEGFQERAFGSPFDYPSSVLVCAPRDMPEPGAPGYRVALVEVLIQLFRATGGRGLALFTSWSQLRDLYGAIAPNLAEDGITVLAQGMGGSRHQLVESFRHGEKMVLLGTASLWEGIDVPGEALSCLVIVRLPFDVPSDPVFAARSEQFDRPFEELAIPRAILRFRQGFGRLIRRRTDRGVLVVLDSRLLRRRYGQAFRASLPPCLWDEGPRSQLPERAARWLEEETLAVPGP